VASELVKKEPHLDFEAIDVGAQTIAMSVRCAPTTRAPGPPTPPGPLREPTPAGSPTRLCRPGPGLGVPAWPRPPAHRSSPTTPPPGGHGCGRRPGRPADFCRPRPSRPASGSTLPGAPHRRLHQRTGAHSP
jgi:hypothetical protein